MWRSGVNEDTGYLYGVLLAFSEIVGKLKNNYMNLLGLCDFKRNGAVIRMEFLLYFVVGFVTTSILFPLFFGDGK